MAKAQKVQKHSEPEVESTGKRGKRPRPAGVSDNEWFLSEAPGRVTRALQSIQSIGRLGHDGFAYTPAQIAQMRKAIDNAVSNAFERLQNRPKTVKAKLFDFS